MSGILLVLRIALSAAFLLAGYTKLRDRVATATGLESFGVPRPIAGPLGVALGACELAIYVGLLVPATAWQSAVGALLLLILFTAVVGFHLCRGKRPPCHCFGQWSAAPIGPGTIVRNVVFLLMASVIAKFDGSDARLSLARVDRSWTGQLSLACSVLGCLLLTVVVCLPIQILRQQALILHRLNGIAPTRDPKAADARAPVLDSAARLPIGAVASKFTLPDTAGIPTALDTLVAAGKPLLLLFVDPDCGSCASLLHDVRTWARRLPLTVTLVSRGDRERNVEVFGLGVTLLLQRNFEVATDYRVLGTPSAIVISPNGRIGSRVATGADAIRLLVERISAQVLPSRSGPAENYPVTARTNGQPSIGDMITDFELPDHSGAIRHRDEFRGRETILLLWNPACDHCQQLFSALRSWKNAPSGRAINLVFVLQARSQAIAHLTSDSTVLVDSTFRLGSWLGARGTPAAIQLDSAGRLASQLAEGADAILSLLSTFEHHHTVRSNGRMDGTPRNERAEPDAFVPVGADLV